MSNLKTKYVKSLKSLLSCTGKDDKSIYDVSNQELKQSILNAALKNIDKEEYLKAVLILDKDFKYVEEYLSKVSLLAFNSNEGFFKCYYGAILLNDSIKNNAVPDILILENLNKALEKGYIYAKYYLAKYHLHNNEVEKGIKLLNELINLKHIDSYILLADYHLNSSNKKELNKGIKLLKKAVKLNSYEALNRLAECAKNSIGFKNNRKSKIFASKCYLEMVKYNKYALMLLGELYENSTEIKNNQKEAFKIYKLAIKKSISEAYTKLGDCYLSGKGVKVNYKKALAIYQDGASLDSFSCYERVGQCFKYGLGCRQNYKTAFSNFQLAAKGNNAKAMCELCIFYGNGYGVKKDIDKSKEWLRKALELNSPDAYCLAGEVYLYGSLYEKNLDLAFKYIKMAMKDDVPNSYYFYGIMYYLGWGVKKDEVIGLKYINIASEKGSLFALKFICESILNAKTRSKEEENQAFTYAKKLEQINYKNGQYLLGRCYEEGIGIKKDLIEANYYYTLSSYQGCEEAIGAYAYNLYNGLGVEVDKNKAFKMVKDYPNSKDKKLRFIMAMRYLYDPEFKKNGANKAVEILYSLHQSGYMEATYFLGATFYYHWNNKQNGLELLKIAADNDYINAILALLDIYGKDLKDDDSFKKYLFRGVKLGDKECQNCLGYLYTYGGKGFGIDYVNGLKYYTLSAEQDNAQAYYNIAVYYMMGYGVEKNPTTARHYLEIAAEKGYKNAQSDLAECYDSGIGGERNFIAAAYWEAKARNNRNDK